MKKKFFTALLVIMMASMSVYAYDMDFLSMNTSAGFSSVENLPSFGGNVKYQYATQVNRHLLFGFGSSADVDLLVPDIDDLNVGTAVTAGPVFVFAPNSKTTVNLEIGPAIYAEVGTRNNRSSYEYVSFGLSADAYFTFYPATTSALGVTIGATGYLMFNNIAEHMNYKGLDFDAKAYFGFTFRGGNYPVSYSPSDYLIL